MFSASLTSAAHADEAAVRATLQKLFPDGSVQGIQKTPVPGTGRERRRSGQVFYVSEDGRFSLGGPLLDVAADRDLTDARVERPGR